MIINAECMKTKSILLFLATCFLLACQKDKIPFYEDVHHVYMKRIDGKYRIDYSFVYSSGAEYAILNLPVTYTGRLLEENALYKVETLADSTTALTGEYEFSSEQEFRAGRYVDTLKVRINNVERLKNVNARLVLRVVTNDQFIASVRDSSQMEIYFTNKIARPDWWNENVVSFYLGTYSDKKLTEFIKIYSGNYGDLSEDDKLYYAREFKYELERRAAIDDPLFEANGERMTVPVVG